MSELFCPKCGAPFDDATRTPRMFRGCGHTFCTVCIDRLIAGPHNGRLACPEAEEGCPVAQVSGGIDDFPVNRILLSHLGRGKSERVAQIPLTGRNVCKEHNKIRDIVCLTDAEPVCSDCALFGSHKAHEFLTFSDFQRRVADDLRQLESHMAVLREKPFSSAYKRDVQLLRENVQQRFNELVCRVEAEFDKAAQELRKQKAENIVTLEKIFERFEDKCDDITAKSEQFAGIFKSLDSQIAEAKALLDNGGLETSGFLHRFCPRSKLQNSAENLHRALEGLVRIRDTDITHRMEKVRVAGHWEKIAPKVTGIVDILLDQGDARGKETTIGCRDSEKKLELLESNMIGGSSNFQDSEGLLSIPEKSLTACKGQLRPPQKIAKAYPARNSKNTVLTDLSISVLPVDESGAKLLTRPNLFTKRLGPNPDHPPRTSRGVVLDKSGIESDISLLDSDVSPLNSPSHRLSKSFLQEIRGEQRETAHGGLEAPENLSSTAQAHSCPKSLLPNKHQGAESGLPSTRNASPFATHLGNAIESGLDSTHVRVRAVTGIPNPTSTTLPEDRSLPQRNLLRNSVIKLTRFTRTDFETTDDRLNTSEIVGFRDSALDRLRDQPRMSIADRIGQGGLGQSLLSPPMRSNTGILGPLQLKKGLLGVIQIKDADVLRTDSRLYSPAKSASVYNTGQRGAQLDTSLSTIRRPDPQPDSTSHMGHFLQEGDPRRGAPSDPNDMRMRNAPKPSSLANENLAELTFRDRKINDASLQSVIPEVARNKKVRVLNLANNFITEAGVETLVKKLAGHPSLEVLNLKGNFIEDRVFEVLRMHARNLKRLNTFIFADNKTLKDRARLKSWVVELRKLGIKVEI